MLMNFFLYFIILYQIKRIESLFVSVGDYSNESIPGLNGPECGLSVEPIVFELSLNNECFRRKYSNKTLVFFDKPKNSSEPQTSHRVFKGVDVRHSYESPWAVWVGPEHWFFNAGTCTGVLITPHWVLTAAHCFDDMKNNWFAGVVLNMGSNTKEGIKRVDIEPDSFFAHPLYSNPSIPGNTEPLSKEKEEEIRALNDIALIKVSGFIPSTNQDNRYFINTICLPKRDEVNYNRENASFYGYGRINDRDSDYLPNYLQKGSVDLHPFRACPQLFCGRFIEDSPRPCLGDSGGPLVQFVPVQSQSRAVLIGTLRGGWPVKATCSNQIKGTFWVPVSKFIDWILKTMKENYP